MGERYRESEIERIQGNAPPPEFEVKENVSYFPNVGPFYSLGEEGGGGRQI